MKKLNLNFPPPPPPEIPQTEILSPGNNVTGGQQYSPSRATSPNSDEDNSSVPPTQRSCLPQRKVLGSDQAKKRLQAYAKVKFTNSPKGKSSINFTNEEEGSVTVSLNSKSERKRYPLVKEATPVMASIMKEETESREIVQKNMEKKNKNRDEVDLRDILNLRKKQEDEEQDVFIRRSRSRERKRTSRRREGSESLSPRQGSLTRKRRKGKSSDDSNDEERRHSGGSGLGTYDGNRTSKSRDPSCEKKKTKDDSDRHRRSSGMSSMLSLDRKVSPDREKILRKKEIKRNMPDLKDVLIKEKRARKEIDLWGLKHGSRDEDSSDSPAKLFTVDFAKKNESILIKANTGEDYHEVKHLTRNVSNLVSNDEGFFMKFPCKYLKYTKSGICFSYNLEMSAEKYKGEKKSAQIRKSIDSMMFELENETKRKRSMSVEKKESSSSKKKKKNKFEMRNAKKRTKTQEKTDIGNKKKTKKLRTVKGSIKDQSDEEQNSSSESSEHKKHVALSAAGISKLFSMAGYADADSENDTKDENIPLELKEAGFDHNGKIAGRDYIHRDEEYCPRTPLQDDNENGASRSPSPSLIADLSRISDIQDEGPRLPKMKDSRSPSKIPIMRDGRSPLNEEPSRVNSLSPSIRKESTQVGSPGIDYNPIREDNLSSRSPSREFDDRVLSRQEFLRKSPGFVRENSLSRRSPDRKMKAWPKSPSKRGRTPSPIREDESRSRKSPLKDRNRSYNTDKRKSPDKSIRSPLPEIRGSPISGNKAQDRNRSPRKLFDKINRSPDQSRPQHDITRSLKRNVSPFNLRRSKDRARSPGRLRSPFDYRRSPLSDRKKSPPRGRPRTPASPVNKGKPISPRLLSSDGRRMPSPDSRRNKSPAYSPGRRSPEWRRGPKSPGRRGPVSPGRPRHPRTPSYSPGPRARSPDDIRRVDRRGFSPRGRDYDYGSPDRRRRFSPDIRGYSPRRRQSPRHMRNVPDSTISDAELARQMPPPSGAFSYNRMRQLSPGYSDSPKRLSLDERLEREHGIKIDQDPLPSLDFSRPPPIFPLQPSVQQQPGESLFRTGLPAMIPTYDDTALPLVVKGPPYPGTQKILNEKEQAMIAANAVANKLQEMQAMQAAKEDERKKKKEQKFAERIAIMEANQKPEEIDSPVAATKTESVRILEEVERQETELKDGDKRKKRKDKVSPTLITLKPFYRPGEKKSQRKKKPECSEFLEEDHEEDFIPRSPIPLPDKPKLRPVLMKPQLNMSLNKKAVKYADGVLPGQGSPDQNFSPPPVSACPDNKMRLGKKKKFKTVVLTVITHSQDTQNDEGPPPPPPGSPTRFPYKELLQKYRSIQPFETTV